MFSCTACCDCRRGSFQCHRTRSALSSLAESLCPGADTVILGSPSLAPGVAGSGVFFALTSRMPKVTAERSSRHETLRTGEIVLPAGKLLFVFGSNMNFCGDAPPTDALN